MKATFNEITYFRGIRVDHGPKSVELPFDRVTARALVVRRRDGAILAARHMQGNKFALIGGGVDEGETPAAALLRELDEEDIMLVEPDDEWRERLAVDYFAGYKELTLWYLISVEDAHWTSNPELFEIRWLAQGEGDWHPQMHTFILHLINRHLPEYARVSLGHVPNS